MLQRIRETLTLALIVLLPFHALLVTVGTKLMVGPGHAPMPMLAVWKEGVLALICIAALIAIAKKIKTAIRIDVIDGLILVLIVLSFIIPSANFALGFKYDFIPLIALLILRRVPWSGWFTEKAQTLLIGVGVILSLYGILTLFLPISFFTWLGYSDAHSLYIPDGPLAAFQKIGGEGIRRIQSTMSGPNQLGIWLLIPLSVCLSTLLARRQQTGEKRQRDASSDVPCLLSLVLIVTALTLTFSRSAWIAAAVIALIAIGRNFDKKIIAGAGAAVIVGLIVIVAAWPAVFVRITSSRDHYLRPLEAIQSIIAHPLGQGLGSAGPASNRVSDACVYLEAGADVSWAKDRTDLCVFVDSKQVQPVDHACKCPFLPENWYLQIGVELGVLGFLLYLALIGTILWRLGTENGERRTENASFSILHFQFSIFLMFIGISIAALFLHAWEDAAVAYTGWMLVSSSGAFLKQKRL